MTHPTPRRLSAPVLSGMALFLLLNTVGTPPARADIFECVNQATGERVWRNAPCGANERPNSYTATETARPAAVPAEAEGIPPEAEGLPPGDPLPEVGAAPAAEGPAAAPPPTPAAADAAHAAQPISKSTSLADVQQVIMVAGRRNGSRDSTINMLFNFQDKAGAKVLWNTRNNHKQKVKADCILFEDLAGADAAQYKKGKQITKTTNWLVSHDQDSYFSLPTTYLVRGNKPVHGLVECQLQLPDLRILTTRTLDQNKIELSPPAKRK
ncbi:MAG: hypothetical protein HQL82_16645 [Magnetococcales bacterium]|nr:hypothetical protein [Magnetococcales bacterium]